MQRERVGTCGGLFGPVVSARRETVGSNRDANNVSCRPRERHTGVTLSQWKPVGSNQSAVSFWWR